MGQACLLPYYSRGCAFDGLGIGKCRKSNRAFQIGDYPTTDYIFKAWTSDNLLI